MLRSPAWRALSLSARRMLDRLEIEMADHGGTDNGKLPTTYDDFHRYGIYRHAIGPAIREAVALGFLKVTEPGRAGNAEWRKPNLFPPHLPQHRQRWTDKRMAEDRNRRTSASSRQQCTFSIPAKDKIPVAENAKF